MVDISITPANVKPGTNSTQKRGIAGATILAGQLVVLDPSTKKYVLADTNHATPELREPDGIALHGASLDQPIAIHTAGDITIGATLIAGTDYWGSDTPGGICPRADVGSGEKVVQVGIAKSTSLLAVALQKPGVTL